MKAIDSFIRSMTAIAAKTKFTVRQNSPEIMLVTGLLAGVGCVVLTGVAAYKSVHVIESAREDLSAIKECFDDDLANSSELTDAQNAEVQETYKQELTKVYMDTGIEMTKLYLPAILTGAASIGSILVSHRILTKRNAAIGAALLTITEGFKEYRSRVKDRFGDEVEREIRYNIKEKTITRTETDPETGETKTVEETVKVSDIPNGHSIYARFLDESCPDWEKNAEFNLMFLRGQQNVANDKLRAEGYLFLNDVYDMIGLPKTQAGQVVGWRYKPNDANHHGDNFVDFGIYQINVERNRAFVNGYERTILLDFNVDGNIWTDSPFKDRAYTPTESRWQMPASTK